MLTGALGAGLVAGLLAALLQSLFVQENILLAERYESGELTHYQGTGAATEAGHDMAPASDGATTAQATHAAVTPEPTAGHDEMSALSRNGLTVVFAVLVYVSYALVMVAGFALAGQFGRSVTARDGLLWGIAGFAAFQLIPAVGLAPNLPGTVAAEIVGRQIWWWGTAVSAAIALALIGYGRRPLAWGGALVLLAGPHLIGAPLPEAFNGTAPPEVASAFAARTLAVGLAAWALLGWTGGWLWSGKTA
ncbi:MAG: CbtA family protein [Gemmobacter sp.]